jgi:TetR/AcrR family transcriptional regulator, transcriptional repressor for nem operon
MGIPRSNKRAQLVQAAGNLVHRRGFNRTTLADIAEESGVRLGNVYYYFKTKSEIGKAIVEHRASGLQMLLQMLDKLPGPKARIGAFIESASDSRSSLTRSGCPVGTLCVELRKEEDGFSKAAAKMFGPILAWLEAQFRELGMANESREMAAHVVAGLQGASLLSHSFGRPTYVLEEAQRLRKWVDELKPGRRPRAATRNGRSGTHRLAASTSD